MEPTKADLLARTPLFAAIRPEAWGRIASRVVPEPRPRRAVLWSPGDPVEGLIVVRSGVLRESVAAPDGARELCLGFVGRGECAGESGVLEILGGLAGPTRRSSLHVHEESVVWSLPLKAVAELVREPAFPAALGAVAAARRARLEERLAALVFRPVEERLAGVLVQLAHQFGVRDSRGVIVNVRLTHRDLGELAGCSRETASVTLTRWRAEAVVAVESRHVVLLDGARLSALSGLSMPVEETRSRQGSERGRKSKKTKGAEPVVPAGRRRGS